MTSKTQRFLAFLFAPVTVILLIASCDSDDGGGGGVNDEFLRGADLSYINEMEDCGGRYKNSDEEFQDPFEILAESGCDVVRVRLWHSADWTDYSNYSDVRKTIQRARAEGMAVLLDFHYSDDWADPGYQIAPDAWLPVVDDVALLGDSVYNYTFNILTKLKNAGLQPEMVQVGNEINSEILQDPNGDYSQINWPRNLALIKKGIQAVRDVSGSVIEVGLHIAQPEHALWWFSEATSNGLTDFDWIGFSYYTAWSTYSLDEVDNAVSTLVNDHNKPVYILETAYPYTMNNKDAAGNILDNSAIIPGYPATVDGQYNYLKDLEKAVKNGGGSGIFYWEPAWISTDCSTRWGQGSHWDNATLFNHANIPTKGMQFFKG